MLSTKASFTYQEYLQLNDNKRYEVLEGELIMAPSPSSEHQHISHRFDMLLSQFVATKDLGLVFAAPLDTILANDQVVQPDLLFIAKDSKNIIKETGIFGAPDLIVEIVSQTSKSTDRTIKFKSYERYGVKEYWILDPFHQSVDVFVLSKGAYIHHQKDVVSGTVYSLLLDGFTLEIGQIFSKR